MRSSIFTGVFVLACVSSQAAEVVADGTILWESAKASRECSLLTAADVPGETPRIKPGAAAPQGNKATPPPSPPPTACEAATLGTMAAGTRLELLDPLAECDGSKVSPPSDMSRVKVETGKLEGKMGCVLTGAITAAAPTASPGPEVRPFPSGTARHMGPLFFDPEGADFTAWLDQFKNEVYRNWILPQPARMGLRGHVDIEFTVERDGSMTNMHLVKSAGQPALDRSAQNALLLSRFLPLPLEFSPSTVTMQVSFRYNDEGPSNP